MSLSAVLLRSAVLIVLVSAAEGQSNSTSLEELLDQYSGLYAGLIVPGALLVLGALIYIFKPSLQRWANSCTCCGGLCSFGCCVSRATEIEKAAETVEQDEQTVETVYTKDTAELPEQLKITIADSSHAKAAHAGASGQHGSGSRPPSRAQSQHQHPSQQHDSSHRPQSQHHSRHDVAATEPSSPSSSDSSGDGSEERYDSYPEEPQTTRSQHRHQHHAAPAATSRTPPPPHHSVDSLHPFRVSRGQSAPGRSGSPLPRSHTPPAREPSPQPQLSLSPSPQLSPAATAPPSPAPSPVELQLAALRSDWQDEKVKQLTQTVDVMGLMLKLQQDNMALTQQLAMLRLQQSSSAPAVFSSQQPAVYSSPQSSLLSVMSPLSVLSPQTAQPQLSLQTSLPSSLPPASPTPVLHLPPPAQQASTPVSISVGRSSDNAASPSSDDGRAAAPHFHDDDEEEEEEEKEADTVSMRPQA